MKSTSKIKVLALTVALLMLVLPALASCEDFLQPSLYEQAVNDNVKFMKDVTKATNDAIITNSPLLKVLNSALKSGTFEVAVKNGEDNEELNSNLYIDNGNFAFLFSAKDGEEELANAGFYFKDKVITVEPGEDEEVSAFKISLDTIKNIISELQGIAGEDAFFALPLLDESELESIISKDDEAFKKAILEIPHTVKKEKVKVGEKEIDCILTTYTLDNESVKKFITTYLNGVKKILDEAGEEFKNYIYSLFDYFFKLISEGDLSVIGDGFLALPKTTYGNVSLLSASDDELTGEKLFDPAFIIEQFEKANVTVEGTFDFAVSQKTGYIVKNEIGLSAGDGDDFELDLSLVLELGENAVFGEDQKLEIKIDTKETAINAVVVCDAEDTSESYKLNAYVDVDVELKQGLGRTTINLRALEFDLDYIKANGEFTIGLSSQLLDYFLPMYGESLSEMAADSGSEPLVTIKGVLKYDKTSVDFSLSSIESELIDEVPDFDFSIKVKTGGTLPQIPEAAEITTADGLCEHFGYDDLESLIGDLFGGTGEWDEDWDYSWDEDWDYSWDEDWDYSWDEDGESF